MEGQKSSYVDLEKAMRAYIHQHRSEFAEEGQFVEDTPSLNESTSPASSIHEGEPPSRRASSGAIPISAGGDAAFGRAMPYLRPIIEISTGVYDLLSDLTGGISFTTGALVSIVLVLVLSNIWTLSHKPVATSRSPLSGSTSSSGSSSSNQQPPETIANVVRGVLQDYFAGQPHGVEKEVNDGTGGGSEMWRHERSDIALILDSLDARIGKLRAALSEVD